MQHYRLILACGHTFETSSVSEYYGQPYVADYVRQVMPSPPVRCCEGDHTVLEQIKIPRLTGVIEEVKPAAPPAPATAPGPMQPRTSRLN